ncbi:MULTISPECIES: bifunctional adenosylcobinamide kinase/adenosylcobinamide-phosphate guanylyltransferase [Clostridium]|uniref:bifunctional adenosylcobinamide kinase/adenosylcobinamide-phosphate guanylyltransferase n=1 Tax=Clostridium TaxID=1485 RepID=UPI0013F0BE6C|nr:MULTISPECIES: bifunctional adenosylcobinamide kinase/adenosylcobinamide-phosphate guanylyltransferase [Clostridium]MBY7026006.1 bifunctional adenosylcobinamide kinase/adenosylcobinamide-phosphate guanylyltransferase [Clostridium botulinum]NFH91978.1 adenosylcobinamide kinase/adenosylcobinamide-phosphate guanylyltransferase [Clostridium botulinum]NFI18831.1 adenosylcobinamide kinase/adenosylcobinamide-phosphate guanylyltransferase [Clostridium botulinum]NFI54665.1 adenosylcobinamide kinase/ad
MNCLIIGGSKSGKSNIGEKIALSLNKDKVIYIATMSPYDDEDKKRVEQHIINRAGLSFITLEQFRDLNETVKYIHKEDTILIDSITSLLINEMFIKNDIIKYPSLKIINNIKEIINTVKNVVIVSDYIFSDSIEYDEISENYKRELGKINKELADICDTVMECSFSNVKVHKGNELLTVLGKKG